MEKTYFIRRNVANKAKNKLDQLLHDAFSQLSQKTITEDNLIILDILFDDTAAQYKDSGGRCEIPKYYRTTHGASYEQNPNIFVHISETCTYVLYPILGEITLKTVKQ